MATSKPFPFDREQKRLLRMLKTHGLESAEDLLLMLGGAVLDYSAVKPELRKTCIRIHNEIDKAKRNLQRARICF